MPFGSVTLIPGVNVERTPTALQAGYSSSQLGRFKDGLFQKYGGWQKFYPNAISGTPRELHAWEDLNSTNHLGVGTSTQLGVITSGSYLDITPQTITTDPAPNFTTTINTATVTIVDAGISNVTTYDAVLFHTPIAVGGLILSGLYAIASIVGVTSYTITASMNATSSVANGGAVPAFTTTSGSAVISVALTAHGRSVGDTVVFPISTTGNGVTISGAYGVTAVADANNFSVTVTNQASASSSFSMNSGNAEFLYYINLGPPAAGAGFGLGAFGSGGFGTGVTSSSQTGTAITATDWTSDNWGQILLACPANGGIYSYDPTGGFANAGLVTTAPPFNGGIFVSMAQQIVVAWGSTITEGIGILQDPMLVRWCTVGDFLSSTAWTTLATNQAGKYRISNGSMIRGGMAVSNQDFIWTDLDLWAMNYVGQPNVFGFNKVMAGAGLISSHAAQTLRGRLFWMGPSNFYSYPEGVIPCPVWDAVFQNLNASYTAKIRAMPNTPFNEVGWLYPSSASTGENDSYVKFNITEPGAPWDYGTLARSAWIDQTVLGNPLAASSGGILYQHETTKDADGSPLSSSFTTGYFEIGEGEEFAFVDLVIPDMKWGFFGGSQGAQVQISFNVVNFPGDTPITYGPYSVTQTTQSIAVRFRGRQMSITVASSDLGSFWRLGKVRYRWAPAGRR